MTHFRRLPLRYSISFFVLFAALFAQIQPLYACHLMDGQPKHSCCCEQDMSHCPMADVTCAEDSQPQAMHCCDVSYETVIDAAVVNSVSVADCVGLLIGEPPPLLVISCLSFLKPSFPVSPRRRLLFSELTLLKSDIPAYFLTRRIRL